MDIRSRVARVRTRDDFLRVMTDFLKEYRSREQFQTSVADYIESICSWVEDMDGYYRNMQLPLPSDHDVNWRVVADLLIAGTIYE